MTSAKLQDSRIHKIQFYFYTDNFDINSDAWVFFFPHTKQFSDTS